MHVSVVIPLYNKARHIGRAVESVLRQTHTVFDLVIVDDGSTDLSVQRVLEFSDPRIRLIRQENAGVSVARNRGVAEARGEWVGFLDADDEWLPDFLETVVRLHAQFPEAKVCGTAYAMQSVTGKLTPVKSVNTDYASLINFWQAATVAQPIHPSSMLVDKCALVAGGGFDPKLIRLEDTELLVRMALRHPIAYSPEVKVVYHMEAENRTDGYLYSGVYPFFQAARAFLKEGDSRTNLPKEAKKYLALMETRSLSANWLTGNRPAMREIIRNCKGIRGFRMRCHWWWLLSLIPHKLVLAGWAVRSLIARCFGRQGKMNPVRSIYRSTTSNLYDKCLLK